MFDKATASANTYNGRPVPVRKINSLRFGSAFKHIAGIPRCEQGTLDWLCCMQAHKYKQISLPFRRILQDKRYWRACAALTRFTGQLQLLLHMADSDACQMHYIAYRSLMFEQSCVDMADMINEHFFAKEDPRWKGSVWEAMEAYLGSPEANIKGKENSDEEDGLVPPPVRPAAAAKDDTLEEESDDSDDEGSIVGEMPALLERGEPPHIPMPPDEDEDSVCSDSDFMITESNLADICEEQDPNHPLPPVREVPVLLKGTFAGDVLEIYLHREPYLMNSYAIAGMVCSPAQIVMDFLRDNPLTGDHRCIVNCHVRKLCRREMPTLALQNIEDARVQCTFWEQQRMFQDHLPPFDDPSCGLMSAGRPIPTCGQLTTSIPTQIGRASCRERVSIAV